jgi:translation initiation factor IF-2
MRVTVVLVALGAAVLAAAPVGEPEPAASAAARCPKIPLPATPPPAVAPAEPARPGPRPDCRPRGEPDVLVPERAAPAPTAPAQRRTRTGKPAQAAEPGWRPPPRRQRPAGRPASRPTAVATPDAALPAARAAPASGLGGGGRANGRLGPFYGRSLIYSGVLGLLLAAVGVTLVGHRRRGW